MLFRSNPAVQDLRASGGDSCGAWLNLNFGNFLPSTFYDPAVLNGWGARPWNWEFSTSVQHEIAPRVAVNVGYFRRVQGNFFVTDNEALSAADFLPFSVTVPTDSRLANSGTSFSGVYDQRATVVNRNVVKAASQFGNQYQHWNGVDANLDLRLANGLLLQGGLATGRTVTDNCDVVQQVPEALLGAAVLGTIQVGVWTPASFCHQESGFVTQYKGLGSYTLPWGGVRVSGTFQSLYGPQVLANVTYTNADIAAGRVQGLGRATFLAAQAAVNVVQPGSVYGDRLNQIDFRVTKIVPVGRGRIEADFDLYNLMNSDAILAQSNVFGANWTRPSSVIQPRFVKFTVRYDF